MVNESEHNDEVDIEVTNEAADSQDIELEEIEHQAGKQLKQLRLKLKRAEEEKMQALEDLQRAKAEFLNARKRLEDEKVKDRTRATLKHAEQLLPLCDSFEMAMSNQATWEKADAAWRKGVEAIHQQLQKLLHSYGVTRIDALGKTFDPHTMEALDTTTVDDKKDVDVVMGVLQTGYQITLHDTTEIIRPARVVTGTLNIDQK
jgi:molecular chaperone GrpE